MRCWRKPPRPSPRSTSPPTTACGISSGSSATKAAIDALTRAFDALPAVYIADGHHRSAAAARVAAARKGGGSHQYFLAVLFPEREMTILDYNRVVKDLNGRSARAVPRRAAQELHGNRVGPAVPAGRHRTNIGMYLAGRWYQLTLRPDAHPERSDRPAADHAADAQRDRAAARHHRSAHRQAHRFRRRRARAGGPGSARAIRRDGGRLRALPDADGTT